MPKKGTRAGHAWVAVVFSVLALWVVSPRPATAQQEFPVQDLKFPSHPLQFRTDRLSLPADAVRFPADTVRFPADAVRFPVEDMAAPVAKSKKEVKFALQGDVMFDFDKATIRLEAELVLQRLAARIKKDFGRGRIRVEGHTDSKGSDSYNKKLSGRRAASVKAWFAQKGGLSSRRISTQGVGEARPVAPNTKGGKDNPEGRQKNRRVEIIVRTP